MVRFRTNEAWAKVVLCSWWDLGLVRLSPVRPANRAACQSRWKSSLRPRLVGGVNPHLADRVDLWLAQRRSLLLGGSRY